MMSNATLEHAINLFLCKYYNVFYVLYYLLYIYDMVTMTHHDPPRPPVLWRSQRSLGRSLLSLISTPGKTLSVLSSTLIVNTLYSTFCIMDDINKWVGITLECKGQKLSL